MQREGEGREREVHTKKRESPNPAPMYQAVASQEQKVTVQSLRKRDEAHPPTASIS